MMAGGVALRTMSRDVLAVAWEFEVTSIGCGPAAAFPGISPDLAGPAHVHAHQSVECSVRLALLRTQGLPRCPSADDHDLVTPTLGVTIAKLIAHWRWPTEWGP